MTRQEILTAAILCLLIVAGGAQGAEGLRLRPLAPIYVDDQDVGLKHPEGVACIGNSRLLVADTGNGRILSYTYTEDTIIPEPPIVLAQSSRPIRVELDSAGDLIVLDGKLRRIMRFDASGDFKAYVDPPGLQGTFIPRNFTLDKNDMLYAIDIFSARVLVIDRDGALIRQIAFPDEYGFISDLTVDPVGNVYAIDSVQRKVHSAKRSDTALSPLTAEMSEDLDFPTAIYANASGTLFIADQHGGGIVILGRDGSFQGRQSAMGWGQGLLRYPTDLCVDTDGNMFVADRENNRIQGFSIID